MKHRRRRVRIAGIDMSLGLLVFLSALTLAILAFGIGLVYRASHSPPAPDPEVNQRLGTAPASGPPASPAAPPPASAGSSGSIPTQPASGQPRPGPTSATVPPATGGQTKPPPTAAATRTTAATTRPRRGSTTTATTSPPLLPLPTISCLPLVCPGAGN